MILLRFLFIALPMTALGCAVALWSAARDGLAGALELARLWVREWRREFDERRR